MKQKINPAQKKQAEMLLMILSGLFIASLITANLTFQKFFTWDFFGIYSFELSVGILPYPLTFLITDVISEVYGKERANKVVLTGLFASLFTLLIVVVSSKVNATAWSPVSDAEFNKVFGLTAVAVSASLMAYLLAQFLDVQLFHFWKRVTKGKHLWLRNNASTFSSQFVDTFTVLFLLCSFGAIEWHRFGALLINGYLYKVMFALLDTPFAYLAVFGIRKKFGLKGHGVEMDF